MNKEAVLYGIIGLLGGSLLTIIVASSAVNNNMTGMMKMMGIHTNNATVERQDSMHSNDMDASMNDMMSSLENKTGDEFDKAFIQEMIVHHQGAVAMAKQAQQNAKHQEIKKMADDIISAQTREIEQMKNWQTEWKY